MTAVLYNAIRKINQEELRGCTEEMMIMVQFMTEKLTKHSSLKWLVDALIGSIFAGEKQLRARKVVTGYGI